MSRATTTHQEKPASEKTLAARVILDSYTLSEQKRELAKLRMLAADLFFSNSEKVVDAASEEIL